MFHYLHFPAFAKPSSILYYFRKRLLYILTIVIVSTSSCPTTKSNLECGNVLPKYGQDSKVIEFTRTAIMDTITVVINGRMTSLAYNETLPLATIELTNEANNYKTTSDFNGQFKFSHIAAGTYNLTATDVGLRPLKADSLHFGTGDIVELKIGLGCMGQDDLK